MCCPFRRNVHSAYALSIVSLSRKLPSLPKCCDQCANGLTHITSSQLTAPEVARAALWIFGEYANNEETITETLKHIKEALGELPMVESEQRQIAKMEEERDEDEPKLVVRTRITADGTYVAPVPPLPFCRRFSVCGHSTTLRLTVDIM